MHLKDPESLYDCSQPPWTSRNTYEWFKVNIELRHLGARGIGAIALTPFTRGTTLGEYVGELIPLANLTNKEYLFDVAGNAGDLGCVDASRVGSWTRFINHSCRVNTEFVLQRLGRQVIVSIVVRNFIDGAEK